MANLCDSDDVKEALGIPIPDSVDDVRIELACSAATQMIQQYCQRQFTTDDTATARVFVPENQYLVFTEDFYSTSGLVVQTDPGLDGSFSQTWSSTDYQLEPLNQENYGEAWPYHTIRPIESLWFPLDYGRVTVKVTAKWGWVSIPAAVQQAAILQAITIFKSSDAPFGATPFADTGILRLRSALHPTSAALVQNYRKTPVGIL
jgi:hypothetical protein